MRESNERRTERQDNRRAIAAQRIKSARTRRIFNLFGLAAALTTMTATIFVGTTVFSIDGRTLTRAEIAKQLEDLRTARDRVITKLDEIESRTTDLQERMSAIMEVPEGTEWREEAGNISHQLTSVANRLDALESALTVDPAKALAVPILRKDLDNVDKSVRAELAQAHAAIDRIYDQNKWLIGLVFTIALSVIGMTVSSFLGRKNN